MSWYNNTDNSFIDATQTHEGGTGGGSITIYNEGDTIVNNTGINTTIADLINIREDANKNFQVYINNHNDNGEIRFYTKNAMNVNDYNYSYITQQYSEPRLTYNTKIDADGILQLYHTYSLLSPQKLSGWYGVDGAITALETEMILVGTGLATNSALIVENQTAFTIFLADDYAPFKAGTAQNFVTIYELLAYLRGSRNIRNYYDEPRVQDLLDSIIGSMPDGTSIARIGGQTDNFNYIPQVALNVSELVSTKANAFNTFVGKLGEGLTYAGIGVGLYALYQMQDKENEERTNDTIILVANLRNYIAEQIAQGNTSEYQSNSHIWVDGLTIQENTNNSFTTAGTYIVEIQKGAELEIIISQNTQGVLVANIVNVIKFGSGFILNENIYVNKSDIGGTSGQLIILVSALRSLEYILEYIDNTASQDSINISNRQRRRQHIPNKDDFSTDGFNITTTTTTETTGEVLDQIEIALKVDTNQFSYNTSGNLQINTSTDGLDTSSGLALKVDTNQFSYDGSGNLQINNYDTFASGTAPTYDPTTGEITNTPSGIYEDIANIYEIFLDGDYSLDTNPTKTISLGYKDAFLNFPVNLTCVALKEVPAGTFSADDYNNDFLGYTPSMIRMSDTQYIDFVQDTNVEFLSDLAVNQGLIYISSTDPQVDYDLNRKFELVIFLRPIDINYTGIEYHILQTGVEILPDEYDIDDYKLKLFIKDNKLNISHGAKYTINHYGITTNNMLIIKFVNYHPASTTAVVSTSQGYREYKTTASFETAFFGVKSIQQGTSILTDAQLYNIARYIDQGEVDLFFHTPIYDPTNTNLWVCPVIYHYSNQELDYYNGILPQNNYAKITIRFKYIRYSTTSSLWAGFNPPDQAILSTIKLRWKVELGADSANITQTEYFSFTKLASDLITSTNNNYFEQDLYLKTTSPEITTNKYKYIGISLAPTEGYTFPSNSLQYYNLQDGIKVFSVVINTFALTPTSSFGWAPNTITATDDFFPTNYDVYKYYKCIFNIDFPNDTFKYYVDDNTEKTITPPTTMQAPVTFQDEDPELTSHIASYIWANINQNGLVYDNDIIVIGNEPIQGNMPFTHWYYNWKLSTDSFLTDEEKDKIAELIDYKYYYEAVKVDKYLKVQELYADVLDFRRLLKNGVNVYDELTTSQQNNLLANTEPFNVLSANTYVPYTKLYDPNPTSSGYLLYNHNSKAFTLQSSTISPSDVENAVDNLIKTTPSTYGLIFNDTNPADKYLQIDNAFINNLINIVLENEQYYTAVFTDKTFSDISIQLKDASSYSPYTLRELVDTTTLYNYVINTASNQLHHYIIREIDQVNQYHPTLGVAFGNQKPIVDYHFQGVITNETDILAGYIPSDYDMEQITPAGQVTYGVAFNNNKNFNGVNGGTTAIRTKNQFEISNGTNGVFSFFHKPSGTNTTYTIFELQDNSGNQLLYMNIEYTNGVDADYVMYIIDQTNSANFVKTIFNNNESETYFDNENCILVWFNFPYYHWYINGKYHGSSITGYSNQNLYYVKLLIDLNYHNNKSLIYEWKAYKTLLFRTSGTTSDTEFNFRRVGEITEFYRLTPLTDGIIIKETSGLSQTKVRAIDNKNSITTLQTSVYTDTDTRAVLSQSAGTGLSWNPSTNQFENNITQYTNAMVYSLISASVGNGLTWDAIKLKINNGYGDSQVLALLPSIAGTDLSWNTSTKTLFVSGAFYKKADVEATIGASAGAFLSWDNSTKQLSCPLNTHLPNKISTGLAWNSTNKTIYSTITQYSDTNVKLYMPNLVGDGLVWNTSTYKIDFDTNIIGTDLVWNTTTSKIDLDLTSTSTLYGNGDNILFSVGGGNYQTMVAYVNAQLTGVNSSTSTNSQDIATNASNISQNTSDIATNTQDIATNTQDIATNTQAINSLSLSVSQNTIDIATNTQDISTNTNNITTNTNNITTNTQAISGLAQSISSLSSSVSQNATDISTNTNDITTNTQAINSLSLSVSQNASDISTNTTNIATNTQAINSLSNSLTALASDVSTNTTDIATLTNNAFSGNYNDLTNKLFETSAGHIYNNTSISQYIGINTTTPGYNLQVVDKLTIGKSSDPNVNTDGVLRLEKRSSTSSVRQVELKYDANYNFVISDGGNKDQFKIAYSAPANSFIIDSGGHCGINRTPNYLLDVGGSLRAGNTGNGSFLVNSSSTDAVVRVNAQNESYKAKLELATPNGGNITAKAGVVLQAIGRTYWNNADFVIGVANTTSESSSYTPDNTYYQRMRMYYNSYTEFFGTGTSPATNYRYFYAGGGLYYSSYTNFSCCIRANGAIITTSFFAASSSIKIKKDVEDLDDRECLDKLLLLQPKKYRYIDESKNFDPEKKVYGFIAEEVKEVLPEAIDDTTPSLIPNIYLEGSVNSNILTLNKELELNVEYTCYIEIDNDDEGNKQAEETKIIVLEKLSDNTYRIDKELNGRIFVYGKIENNFNCLKKEYFHALTISAVQELHRTIQRQQEQINTLMEILARNNIS